MKNNNEPHSLQTLASPISIVEGPNWCAGSGKLLFF